MSSENVAIVRRLVEAYEQNDIETQLAILDPDVELVEWPEGIDRRTFRGHDGARQAAESWGEAWEWLRNDVDDIVEAGDKVLVCGRTRGKGRGSAVEVAIDAFNVYTLHDGRVKRIEFFTTKEPALEAAGLAELTDGPSAKGNVELVLRSVDAFNRMDLAAMDEYYDPDVELREWPTAPGAQTYYGIAGMRAALDNWFDVWDWMQVEVADVVEAGDCVLATLRQRAKGKGSEIEVETTSYNVYRIRDGKVISLELFTERESALQAAGLTPEYEEEKR